MQASEQRPVKTLEAELTTAQARIAEIEAQAKRYEKELDKMRQRATEGCGDKEGGGKPKLMPCCADKKTRSSKNKEVTQETKQPTCYQKVSAKVDSRRDSMWQIGSLQEDIQALQEQLKESTDINKRLFAELEKVRKKKRSPLATDVIDVQCYE